MNDLKDKVAVITGAASGIGLGIARLAVQKGMKVVIADIEGDALEEAAKELKELTKYVLAVTTDVSKAEQVDALAEKTLAHFGAVHLLVNNAGVGGGGCMWELDTDYWDWVLGVNLWGVIHGVRAFTRHMVEQKLGHIVNTASIAGLMSAPGMGPYNVSKHAVVSLSETLFGELRNAQANVGVSVLCPSYVDTKIYAAERNRPVAEDDINDPARLEEQKLIEEAGAAFFKTALPTEQLAEMVFDAIENEQFYILSHKGTKAQVEKRMNTILEDGNPNVTGPEEFPLE
jgi:NAD(P)-dependent dehydrogenase (short-subunit alcohol dehydrogenase family)